MSISRKPSILVVYPSYFYYVDRDEIKSSQLLLASYLSEYFPVEYADFELSIGHPSSALQIRRYKRRVRQILAEHRFDILAISCWTSLSFQASLITAEAARELYPDCLIVIGGYHSTARPGDFCGEDSPFDYVIRGEGETALKAIAEGFPGSGRPAETKIVEGVSLAPGDYVDVNWDLVDDILRSESPAGVRTLCIYLSRGCPFSCSFCMESLKDQKWRPYPVDRAIDMVRQVIERYHPRAVAFGDASFGVQSRWRKEFLRRLAELKPDCWLLMETRPELLDAEDIELLAGLKTEIQFGVESGSPEMLRLMNKTRQPEKFLADFQLTSRILSEHNIVHGGNLIFNHPGETERTLKETFAYIESGLTERQSSLMWAYSAYAHYPGNAIDSNRAFYEEKFGTEFRKIEWWLEEDNPIKASRQVIPSRDLRGERTMLWWHMLKEREGKIKNSLTPRAFFLAAESYFPEWREDPRYKEYEEN